MQYATALATPLPTAYPSRVCPERSRPVLPVVASIGAPRATPLPQPLAMKGAYVARPVTPTSYAQPVLGGTTLAAGVPMQPVLHLPLKAHTPMLDDAISDGDASTNASPCTEAYVTPIGGDTPLTPMTPQEASPKHTFEQDYELKRKVLGSGAAGDVCEAVCRRTGEKVAVKTYTKAKMSEKALRNMRGELEVQGSLSHPGIVRLLGVYESEPAVHVVMEQLLGGELFDRIIDCQRFTEPDAASVAVQLLRVLVYLHANNIIHRDIKPENVMYVAEGGETIKLIDFGFATAFDPRNALTQKCGTMQYVAPEVLMGHKYGEKVDLWSLGNVVYIMLTGRPLYGGDEKDILKKKKAGILQLGKNFRWCVSDDGQDFVKQLLELDPKKRLSAFEALSHPWLKKHAPQEVAAALVAARRDRRRAARAAQGGAEEDEVSDEDVVINKVFALSAHSTREFDPTAEAPCPGGDANLFSACWWWRALQEIVPIEL